MIRVISGPTGSGKTDLALKLSKTIFNADSFQFYREIPILSNQPIPTDSTFYFLGNRSIRDPISAGEYAKHASPYLDQRGVWVGTGLYLHAALYGLDATSKKGTPFQYPPKFAYKMLVIDKARDELYRELNNRVDQMLARGAISEAQAIETMVQERNLSQENAVLKAIGLKHLLLYLRKELEYDEAIRLWKRDTRRLAKRQWTWLRKFSPPSPSVWWVTTADLNLEEAHRFLES